MLFNSLGFAIFLPIVFGLYWFWGRRSVRVQNLLLLVASYFFYSCWNWKFVFLLIFSTLLDFFTGIKMSEATDRRTKRFWFWLSITVNIGFLGAFKYYNFFAQSFEQLFSNFGFRESLWTVKVILPVGISFYTLHGLSYVIDVYNDRIKAQRNFVDYAVFVCFFPLLVAGPIERATHLLPQIKQKRSFDYSKAVDGLKQMLWGFFKKIVIADQCAVYANLAFNHPNAYSGSTLVVGAVMFAIQIYCDFSGYSDIALGIARLFGIDLLRNFAFPYFSRDIAEFWRRWHISLSSWFRDYLYIPLGGSKGNVWVKIRNTFIIFLVSGFWHGANWTFIVWGALNALFILPSIVLKTNRKNLDIVAKGRLFPTVREFVSIVLTFGLTVFAWIFFRADSLGNALTYIKNIFTKSLFQAPDFSNVAFPPSLLICILLFFSVEWFQREHQFALQNLGNRWSRTLRWQLYSLLTIIIFYYFAYIIDRQPFIYFQF
jgi:alginate O-acetyltransferase complex protein AlgI